MYDNGFKNIFNVDFSESVIKKAPTHQEMSLLSNTNNPKMFDEVMEILELKIENGKFDAVIDQCLVS
jgi:hypothetical protein